jgi:hypothetical protein
LKCASPPRWLIDFGLLFVASGCHGAAYRIPTRFIDDPITLPEHIGRLNVSLAARSGSPLQWPLRLELGIGLTSRTELRLPLQFVYAVAEEHPLDNRHRAPLSLALNAGASSVGLSTPVFGTLVQSGVLVRKRVGPIIRLSAAMDATAPLRLSPQFGFVGRTFDGRLIALVQLGDHLALYGSIEGAAGYGHPLFEHEMAYVSPDDRFLEGALHSGVVWRFAGALDAGVQVSGGYRRTTTASGYGAPLASPDASVRIQRINGATVYITWRW